MARGITMAQSYIHPTYDPSINAEADKRRRNRYQSKTIRGTNYYKRDQFFYTYYSSVYLGYFLRDLHFFDMSLMILARQIFLSAASSVR